MSIQKSTDSSSLAEVIDRILDKGIVIDVSLVGIEILTVEARVVIASVDTWLRYAEAVGLLSDEGQEERSGRTKGNQPSPLGM
ncbi:gas vesicle structural protein GvpA [Bacillus thermotolerans]|uniref:gas vesicle structural protein GvpA n=1 Tax=Bacillus thermotolerans TaxID=1221996 RepID=UPI0005893264|nr:gas vesicle structural protein GvpA [Bacillus thermotolerans]KKB44738.1 Gas vesicle structural protein [Bacillus thermotolerans]